MNLSNNDKLSELIESLILSHENSGFDSYDKFLECVYVKINRACTRIQGGSKKISSLSKQQKIEELASELNMEQAKKLNEIFYTFLEDDISMRIVDIIAESEPRFRISHDAYHNGHVDIIIIYDGGNHIYKWIGEAKIWSGAKYISQGLGQLLDYSTGDCSKESGGILIYVDNSTKKLTIENILDIWEKELQLYQYREYGKLQGLSIINKSFNSLTTKHAHHQSGHTYEVKHLIVDLRSATL